MSHPALRLTPSNSPFFKNSIPRSPVKASKPEEPGLRLSKVIGTTTISGNGFAFLPSARKFAYTAGAAAVVATVGEDLQITQRFHRARPTTVAGAARDANGQIPTTPTPNEPRSRALGHVKDNSLGASPLGASGRDWSDSPSGRTTSAKDRVKAATSVALSPNGKWLAVGESGHRPRILIFALAEDATDAPVTILAEHTFGVQHLSFSLDSKYLASLGTVNDGFLYLWQISDRTGGATLHASNKCTTVINCMTWMGSSLITAGLRFVKVWRPDEDAGPEPRRADSALSPLAPRHRADDRGSDYGNSILSPKHRVFAGKNSLLGDMLDANFVSVVPLSDTETVICAETGEVCLLNDVERAQILTCVGMADFPISSAVIDSDGSLRVVGGNGQVQRLALDALRDTDMCSIKQQRKRAASTVKMLKDRQSTVIAMASLDSILVELSPQDGIRVTNNAVGAMAISNQLPAHDDAVLGALPISCSTLASAAFLTFAGNGTIRVWNAEGAAVAMLNVPIDASLDVYGQSNEVKTVAPFADGSMIAAGDKYGTLTILDVKTNSVVEQVQAHSAEFTGICAFDRSGLQLLATSSRDRTVQLFSWTDSKLVLLQTMDEHAGALTQLMVTSDRQRLLSCSADRTVVVREAMQRSDSDPASVVYVMLRTINLKSAPTSMCFGPEEGSIYVATTDRSVTKYSTKSGQAGFSFKCSDPEGGEAATMSRIGFAPSSGGSHAIFGICSDKSVRLYSDIGTLIARDWGHTEGITDIALLPAHAQATEGRSKAMQLVTVAADSTIFMWDTASSMPAAGKLIPNGLGIVEEGIPTPLRKVISYSELSRFRREVPASEGEPSSPTTLQTSPQRLRKKPSRMSIAPTPRLEPAFRSSVVQPSSRRRSLRQRSPSPPSPRNTTKNGRLLGRPALSTAHRSKSTENVFGSTVTTTPEPPASTVATGPGSLTASTESVCRTLRAYRKKLVGSASGDGIGTESLRELEKELKLTARVLSEKSQGKSIDEAMMARLLDQASEKIVGMLDERIKERVESEVRRSSEASPRLGAHPEAREEEHSDALAGALERVAIDE
ncbi:hypothetical protein LTR08_004269 [Meristemomyces frigidus]|nr:hypothetical protein LTR08_004269 [Meristemomyces frigidus]